MKPADLMEQRCSAKSKHSGERCARVPRLGSRVCHIHGGAAPQVKKAAEERIRELVDPALNRLAQLLEDDSPGVALGAVKDVLDRAGYSAKQQVDITSKGEQIKAYVGVDLDRV